MNKVLIGVGIGCGSLVLLGGVALVAGGLFVGKKMEGVMASGPALQDQQQKLAKLNQRFAFTAPQENEPLQLEEARLTRYFAVRSGIQPVFKKFEEEGKKLEKKDRQPGFSEVMEAANLMSEMLVEVRGEYLKQLEQQQMSPREFHHITLTLYSSPTQDAVGKAQKEGSQQLTRARRELERQLERPGLAEQERTALEAQVELIEAQLGSINEQQLSPGAQAVHAANVQLIERYRSQIDAQVNPFMDVLVLGWQNEAGALDEG